MLDFDAGFPPTVLVDARGVVEQYRQNPQTKAFTVPHEVMVKLSTALSNATFDEVVELRSRERTVSLETLRMTLR